MPSSSKQQQKQQQQQQQPASDDEITPIDPNPAPVPVSTSPPPPPPTPVAPTRNAIPILSALRALPSQTAISHALACARFYKLRCNLPLKLRRAQASVETVDTFAFESIDSLLALLEGLPGTRPQWWFHSSDTLESLWPWLPESSVGDEVDEPTRLRRIRRFFARLLLLVLLHLQFKRKAEVVEVVEVPEVEPESTYLSFDEIFAIAARRIAEEAAAVEAAEQATLTRADTPRPSLTLPRPCFETEQTRAEDMLRRQARIHRGLPPAPPAPAFGHLCGDERPADCPCGRHCVCYRTPRLPLEPTPVDRRRRVTQLHLPVRFATGHIANTRPSLTRGLNTLDGVGESIEALLHQHAGRQAVGGFYTPDDETDDDDDDDDGQFLEVMRGDPKPRRH